MTIKMSDFVNVSERLEELGCNFPKSGLALLPANIASAASADELKQASEAATVKKLMRQAELPVDDIVSTGHRLPAIKNKHFEWAAPVLFISHDLYTQSPALVTIALNVISNAAYDFLKGTPSPHRVKLDIAIEVEPKKTTKRISYVGSVEGLKELPEAIREAMK